MANQLQKFNGLVSGDVFGCLNDDITKVPASLYSIRRRQLPLSAAQTKKDFQTTIQFFAGSTQNDDGDDSSNTVITNAPALPFLLRCVQPFVAMDPVGFTAAGEALALSSIVAGQNTPYVDGIAPAPGQGVNLSPAFLEWGLCTQKAAYNYLQSYRFQMPLSGTFILFDELGADIGTTDSHNPWEGFSNSLSALPEYVRSVNDNIRNDPNNLSIFLPATGQDLAAPGDPVHQYAGVPTPLVPSSYGGLISDGIFHGAYPAPGLLLLPGTPIYLNAIRDTSASIYYNALVASVQNRQIFTYDQALAAPVAPPGGGVPAVGQAQFTKFIGGTLSTGATLRGANLTPMAVIVWYASLSGMFRNHYNITQHRDIIDSFASAVNGLEDKLGGKPITQVRKSELLRTLAGMSEPDSVQHQVLSRLAGSPSIDEPQAA